MEEAPLGQLRRCADLIHAGGLETFAQHDPLGGIEQPGLGCGINGGSAHWP
jgi:hypothetical protein